MRQRAGFIDDPSALNRAYTRGHGVPIGWRKDAPCSRRRTKAFTTGGTRKGGEPSVWLVEPQERYKFGDGTVSGEQLLEVALGQCSLCPVQWDCASAAVEADEPWGVWGMTYDDLEWVKRRADAEGFIRDAQRRGQPIQFAVSHARQPKPIRMLA